MKEQVLPGLFARDVAAFEPARTPVDPPVMDKREGARLRDIGMARVDANASDEFKEEALRAIYRVASEQAEFCADDVWPFITARATNNKALGPVMRRAVTLGYCVKTDRAAPSRQSKSHCAPTTIWRSLICRKSQ